MASDPMEEDLLPSIRQLLTSVTPMIGASGSLPAAEEMLMRLEETDENFHRYELVKFMRRRIEETLAPLIDAEIEKQVHEGDNESGDNAALTITDHVINDQARIEETLAPLIDAEIEKQVHEGDNESGDNAALTITDHVINDQACIELMQTLKHGTKDAVERLVQAFDEEHLSGRGRDYQDKVVASPTKHRTYSFSDDSSLDSSFNQSSYMFMNQEQFTILAENLETSQPLETRQEALRLLLTIPPSDVLACEQWGELRQGLLHALSDSDEFLAEKSLNFHARMFSSNSHHIMREVFTSLVEHLSSIFANSKTKQPLLRDGIDYAHPIHQRIIKKFRLMNEFQIEVPTYWVRYPERFLEEVTESTIQLLVSQPSSGQRELLCPIHYMAVVDPRATWFKKWLHGNYSRTTVINLCEKHIAVVKDAVACCMEYISTKRASQDTTSRLADQLAKQHLVEGTKRTRYTGQEVEFFHFMHSLCLLGRLVLYSGGADLFPIQTKNGEVSLHELLVSLVHLITECQGFDQGAHSPSVLVTETLKMLCTTEASCYRSLCKDTIITELLKPVLNWLHNNVPSSEGTMLHVADIFSAMAEWESGKQILLYGENGDKFKSNSSAAVHAIASFTKKALDDSSFTTQPSQYVIGAFLFVCRQFYSTSDGLLVLHPYGLHHYVADSWLVASREVAQSHTPTPGMVRNMTPDIDPTEDTLAWEQALIDNLLNFASTPKGLLLLQQTGAINEAVAYMYARYAKKLQVSKTEKFGYGTMVTQVAATAPGIVALQSTGFVKTLINGLWRVLECGPEDRPLLRPSPPPMQPNDRATSKFFTSLMNLLSAFPAVFEVLAEKELENREMYTFREIPDTIIGLLDRLVMVNSTAKIHSLFNEEPSQMFGLRLLSVMTCCLDTLLLLECQYKIWDLLLQGQENNKTTDGDNVMVDMLSVERNHILVRSYVIGGPSERRLPGTDLEKGNGEPYPWPLFASFPVPKEYTTTISRPSAIKQDTDLSKLLSKSQQSTSTANSSKEWLQKSQTAYCKVMSSRHESVTNRVITDLLDKVLTHTLLQPDSEVFPLKACKVTDSALKGQKLTDLQMLGIKMVIRYGQHLKLISNSSDATENLTLLLKKCRYYFRTQQRSLDSEIRCLQGDYTGHDWFVSTVFLLMAGNRDKAWSFLHNFSGLLASGYLWMPRLHASVHLPVELAVSGIHPVFSTTGYNVELILQTEVPHVYSAFRMSGYTPSQICQHWLRQCFWNYLDWQEICHYITVCIVMGIDYQVYVCVAIMRYLQPQILLNTQQQTLQVFLKENGIKGFCVGHHIEYMKELETKFRTTVLPDMQNLNQA